MSAGAPGGRWRLADLAALVGAELRGDGECTIRGLATLEAAGPEELSVFHHPRYTAAFAHTRAGAVLMRPHTAGQVAPGGPTLLVSADPYLAYARLSAHLHPAAAAVPGIDPRAVVEGGAQIDPSAEVGPLVFVGRGAVVGARCRLRPGAFVGAAARLGADCLLHPGAVVAEGCSLGDRVILQAGAVVGSDGFGYALEPDAQGEPGAPDSTAGPRHLKIPQIGTVRIEADVELGANSCVDRGALGETVIGRGTKIDNLVQIAHNVRVGPLSILCAQVGVAGSTSLGHGVVLGGQVGIVGHATVGAGARIGAGSGVMEDVAPGDTQSGSPAVGHRAWLRQVLAIRELPSALKELAGLRARVATLEAQLVARSEAVPSVGARTSAAKTPMKPKAR